MGFIKKETILLQNQLWKPNFQNTWPTSEVLQLIPLNLPTFMFSIPTLDVLDFDFGCFGFWLWRFWIWLWVLEFYFEFWINNRYLNFACFLAGHCGGPLQTQNFEKPFLSKKTILVKNSNKTILSTNNFK